MKIRWIQFRRGPRAAVLVLLGLLVAAGALSSCLPGPHGAYYKPSYPDANVTLRQRDCYGEAGPLSVLKIPIEDGFVVVRLDTDDSLDLGVSLESSATNTLQFSSDVIRVSDPDRGTTWDLPADPFYVRYLSAGKIPASALIDFSGRIPAAPEDILSGMEVWIPFSLDDFSPDTVRVRLPPIVAGEKDVRFPPLTWKADRLGTSVDGYEKDWEWFPYMEDKIEYGRMRVRAGATGGIQGSSKVDPRLKLPALEGNIMIGFPADMTWRFAKTEVVFEDAGSGETRRMPFSHVLDRSSLDVAFTARFCCLGSAWSHTTLPAEVKRPAQLRVELPPLLINGKKVVIKPITFELHRFGFGIYPFNC